MNFETIKAAAEGYRADMSRFLRDMISHPSESCEEKDVVMCIKAEMEKLGYDKVEIDGLGNVIGWMGQGDKIIAIDSHIDTVGIGNINNWTDDPYKGWEDDAVIYGRGGSDQEGGMASATYGAKIMKDLGLIPEGYKIMVVGSVQEEDCDGMCWQYIVNKYFPANGIKKEQVEFVISTEPTDGGIYRGHRGRMDCDGMCWQYIVNKFFPAKGIKKEQVEFVISTEPTDGGIYRGHRGRMEIRVDVKGVSCHGSAVEFVISTEPTDGGIYRGHRGRMEIRVDVKGVSCHGSAPERGDNAIYKMADILQDVRALNENDDADETEIKGLVKMLNPKYNPEHYEDARFLGRGTCTTSQIFYTSPSRCAVADSCSISVDRRMTAGETWDSCLQEIRDLPSVQKYGDDVKVSMYMYDRPSWTGEVYETEAYFPETWDSCLQEIRDLPSVQKYGDDVKVSMYMYDRPSWTGEVYETEAYFPTWINKESAAHVQALVDAHHVLFGTERLGYADADIKRDAMHLRAGRPLTDKWTFSTNGVAIQGRYGIPCVGFGPGAESQAHAPNEITWKDDLVRCAALYAAVPGLYKEENKTDDVTQFRAGKTNNDIK